MAREKGLGCYRDLLREQKEAHSELDGGAEEEGVRGGFGYPSKSGQLMPLNPWSRRGAGQPCLFTSAER